LNARIDVDKESLMRSETAVSTSTAPLELEVERQGAVVRLILNRPERRNALSRSLLGRLEEELAALGADTAARVVVLAARGPVFCAGHDLSEMTGRTEEEYRDLFETCTRVMLGLRRLPQPVIARVQGTATAAGCQLVAACDLAIAAQEASFATPVVPLVRAIPDKPALEMLFTGRPINAERACALGLINRVVPADELDAALDEFCGAILAVSPAAIRLGKAAFYALRSSSEESAYLRAIDVMTENALLPDGQEGIVAFLQKRPPCWSEVAPDS
jgi:enoyl-CoA hydratase/carnithine racemase